MKEYSFEKLEVWQDCRILTKQIYQITKKFPEDERFGLTNQIRRSVISVSSNIVEGSYRTTNKDKANFMNIAYSSLMELLSQLILSKDLEYLTDNILSDLREQIEKISNKLNALTKYFKKI